ncbi:MAG: protein adenylyltransferase SelO family protein, partial [Rhodoferax sp.]|nr:protein adenylyltransferase SelO family protein [Rhodoferax sp.]
LPLIVEQELALAALESFKTLFPREFEQRMGAKLGLSDSGRQDSADDRMLIQDILQLLAKDQVDYTIFWRRLSHSVADADHGPARDLFLDRSAFAAWWLRYKERLSSSSPAQASGLMLKTNPKFVLRNHLAELAIQSAKLKDFSLVDKLLTMLESPFEEHPDFSEFAAFPPDWAHSIEISCSS